MKLPNGYGSVTKLSGKRRRPYVVKRSVGWDADEEQEKATRKYEIIGYTATRAEGLQLLADFNSNPYDVKGGKLTFAEVYDAWSKEKFPTVSESSVKSYESGFNICKPLHGKIFSKLKLSDLQSLVDECGKNYPMIKKVKILLNQMYDHAVKYDWCSKDYSQFVNIQKHADRNPNKHEKKKLTREQVDLLWKHAEDKEVQLVLMMIYSGVRIAEMLALKKENIDLEKQYFNVVASKTENGIRTVPIADKVLEFFENRYQDSDSEYLIHNSNGGPMSYDAYKDHFQNLMSDLGIEDRTPYCTRHTCASMLYSAKIDQTTVKKIMGHGGSMSLTERVYTHPDVEELLDAINKI